MIARFADEENGGFFETSDDHEQLVARRKDLEDHPIPSGNSSAALRPAAPRRHSRASTSTNAAPSRRSGCCTRSRPSTRRPSPTCSRRSTSVSPPVREVALVGPDREPLERVVRSAFRPHLVLAGGEPDGVPLLEGRTAVDGRAAAYVCERFACRAPVTEPEELERLLS